MKMETSKIGYRYNDFLYWQRYARMPSEKNAKNAGGDRLVV